MKAKLYDQIVTLVDVEVDFGQRLVKTHIPHVPINF